MSTKRIICIAAAMGMVATLPAEAYRSPENGVYHPVLEAYEGPPLRLHRPVATSPLTDDHTWQAFLHETTGTWMSLWDADTNVPIRIYGSGIEALGAVADADTGLRHARGLLREHVELLAPGSSASDFDLASNVAYRGMRTVGFTQTHAGMPVEGGQVSFLFKNDRAIVLSSSALPHVEVSSDGVAIADRTAVRAARRWIEEDFGGAPTTLGVEGPVVVPLVREGDEPIAYETALVVTVDNPEPRGQWRVYVDAQTGTPVARLQMLRFGSGTLLYDVPERWPGGNRIDHPAAFAGVQVDGSGADTDADGVLTWNGGDDVSVTTGVTGPYVAVDNQAGGEASATLTLSDGGQAVWSDADREFGDAQLNTFVHANVAKAYLRDVLNPGLEWAAGQMDAAVNINQSCNAYSDGDSINFYRAGSTQGYDCGNTGRLADVVYHEFGHSLHGQSIIPGAGSFDSALSEGLSDYYAATITDDPAMGIGFFSGTDPLRHIDPPDDEAVYPDDVSQTPHTTGLIIGGALWDMRKELVASMGEADGILHADRLFYAVAQRAEDIPSAYPEVLAADDDDGDLANGTPNKCLIDRAFALHGLAMEGEAGFQSERPVRDGFDVSVHILPPSSADCPAIEVDSGTITWEPRADPSSGGTVDMSESGDDWTGTIPSQPLGTVVKYQVALDLADGSTVTYPQNPADPMYEFFVGTPTEIYCTDFESDPFADGWSSNAAEGEDDWAWGEPAGVDDDPGEAYSGSQVLGNDLEGAYPANTTNSVTSPAVDVSGYDNVRLQYRRWLNVEDGFWDNATIYANDTQVWQNANSDQGEDNSDVHHTDREWRFHDVDLTEHVVDGSVQVRFEIATDQGLHLGGWTLDDVCVVAYSTPMCGNGEVEDGEECDDGNDISGDGCEADCTTTPDPGGPDAGPGGGGGGGGADDGDAAGGCCDAGARPGSGTGALALMVLAGLALLLRRRATR